MKFDAILQTIITSISSASALLNVIGQLTGWTGGPKLAGELNAVAAKAKTAFRTDPVFKAEMEAGRISPTWDEEPAE